MTLRSVFSSVSDCSAWANWMYRLAWGALPLPVEALAIEPNGTANEPSDIATTVPTNTFPRFISIVICAPSVSLELQKLQDFGERRSLSDLLPIEGARTRP